jgi:predicted nucleotide-binding protein (sugar kinase/HSP70/actin superfamily)
MRVGIPRALLFHHYGDCWLEFLESIGAEPVLSPPTTGDIITNGATRADNETCLPVKVFSGDILSLKDEVDAMLVPRVVSQGHGRCSCPKFFGLPDLVRALDAELPPVVGPGPPVVGAGPAGTLAQHRRTDWKGGGRDTP